MSMSIGGATVALVEHRHGGMICEAYPTRLALVFDLVDNGALGGGGFHGDDAHKAALKLMAEHIVFIQAKIAEREERDAYIGRVRDGWLSKAVAQYVEHHGLDAAEARCAADSLFNLVMGEVGGELPDPAQAVDEDVATWGP